MTPPDSTPSQPSADVAQEVDIWWGSYSARALLPALLLSALCTLLVLGAVWFLGNREVQVLLLWVVVALWLLQILWWARRLLGSNYRLTSHRLFMVRGVFGPHYLEVDLARVSQVQVKRKMFDRMLKVGRVVLKLRGQRRESIVLEGVQDPDRVAAAIRATIARHTSLAGEGGV
jgi:uncharacterized membrane protein YdbT with pleckstrin-like domain